jgi:hypothetical protein
MRIAFLVLEYFGYERFVSRLTRPSSATGEGSANLDPNVPVRSMTRRGELGPQQLKLLNVLLSAFQIFPLLEKVLPLLNVSTSQRLNAAVGREC